MSGLAWLTAKPIAHRGLHDAKAGTIENTPAAISAAITAGYAFEVDLQITADDEAVVYHDDALGRLTEGSGALKHLSVAQLKQVPFKATSDRIITLDELCRLVAGRTTMVLELKSHLDDDPRLAERVAAVLKNYSGPVAVMSFDPFQIAMLKRLAPGLTRGIIAQHSYADREWDCWSAGKKYVCANLLHGWHTRPHFVAYGIKDLPRVAPFITRNVFGLPLLTWTVRSAADRQRAERWTDQIIFEGFRA